VPPHDARIGLQERQADIPGEGEVGVPVAAVQVVVEDPADPARLVPVLQEEVLVAPLFEPDIVVLSMRIAGLFQPIMECLRVCLLYTSDAADDMQCVDLGGRRLL